MTPIEDAFIDLAHAEKKDPQWVIKDTIPVGLTFLAGPPKVSHKSTISLVLACLAARWSCRCLPPWMDCLLGGPTMAFSYEADAGEVRSIIEDGLGVSITRGAIWIATDPWKFQLDVGDGPQGLVQYLDIKMPRVIIMDPFRNMWSGDENDSGAVIKVLGPMQRWLKANEAAGIVVHHVNKPPKEGGGDAWSPGNMFSMRGSSAIPGLADGIIVVEPTRNEGVVTLHTRFKRGPAWKRTIQLGVPGYGWPSQGYEHIPEQAQAVRDSYNNHQGTRDLDWLAQEASARKLQIRTVQDMLALLDRNHIVQFTQDERRNLLPRAI